MKTLNEVIFEKVKELKEKWHKFININEHSFYLKMTQDFLKRTSLKEYDSYPENSAYSQESNFLLTESGQISVPTIYSDTNSSGNLYDHYTYANDNPLKFVDPSGKYAHIYSKLNYEITEANVWNAIKMLISISVPHFGFIVEKRGAHKAIVLDFTTEEYH